MFLDSPDRRAGKLALGDAQIFTKAAPLRLCMHKYAHLFGLHRPQQQLWERAPGIEQVHVFQSYKAVGSSNVFHEEGQYMA